MNIYNELAQVEQLKEHIKDNQNKVLDLYTTDNEHTKLMEELLIEMNQLLEEAEQIDAEMQELMKQI
jgi:hypothetical protein